MEVQSDEKARGCVARLDCPDEAYAVRRAVFVEEQGYTDEFDALDADPACVHVTVFVGGQAAGCARMVSAALGRRVVGGDPSMPPSPFDEEAAPDEVFRLGRVAVLPAFRGRGLAHIIVRTCEEVARERGARVIKLHAQEYIQGLYAAHGYVAFGDVDYEDEGQPHVWMAKRL